MALNPRSMADTCKEAEDTSKAGKICTDASDEEEDVYLDFMGPLPPGCDFPLSDDDPQTMTVPFRYEFPDAEIIPTDPALRVRKRRVNLGVKRR